MFGNNNCTDETASCEVFVTKYCILFEIEISSIWNQ